jgi:hypothetical protein
VKANDYILFELWDEDATLKLDKDDLVGMNFFFLKNDKQNIRKKI